MVQFPGTVTGFHNDPIRPEAPLRWLSETSVGELKSLKRHDPLRLFRLADFPSLAESRNHEVAIDPWVSSRCTATTVGS